MKMAEQERVALAAAERAERARLVQQRLREEAEEGHRLRRVADTKKRIEIDDEIRETARLFQKRSSLAWQRDQRIKETELAARAVERHRREEQIRRQQEFSDALR